VTDPGAVALDVALEGPLDVPRSLEVLRRWGDDLLDRWDGEVLLRTLPTPDGPVAVAARQSGTPDAPRFVAVAERDDAALGPALATTFLPTPPAWPALVAADPAVARAEAAARGVRVLRLPDALTALVRAVTAQQVNLGFATTLRRRLAETYGTEHTVDGRVVRRLDAARLAAAEVADLRTLQLSTAKATAVTGLAAAAVRGELDLERFADRSDEEAIADLTAHRGVGRWTAEWFLVRVLGRPAVVAGDLGVRKAVGAAYLDGRLPSEAEVREVTAHWGDAAALAQQVLLEALAVRAAGG
jgi:DNA-3-methyladenine glycosylase II